MENFFQDVRYSLRTLFKRPSYTAIGVIALAIGIGATTAIFTVVNSVLLRSLPYKDPDRIVTLNRDATKGGLSGTASYEYLALQQQNEVFDQVAAYSSDTFNLTGIGEPERISCAEVSASLFPLLGVQPLRGRTFTEAEDRPGAGQVAVVSEGFWKSRFGGDEEATGRTLTLNDKPYTIVGIMPASFRFPRSYEIWVTSGIDFEAELKSDRVSLVEVLARIKDEATVESAQANTDIIMARVAEQHTDMPFSGQMQVVPLHRQMVGDIRFALLLLFGAVGFVLLIACANVANLMLARSAEREREIAIRAALGATRWRIARQLIIESILLAFIGGAAGALLALWGIDLIVSNLPKDLAISLPGIDRIGIDLYALGFTLAVSFLTGILFGLAPALAASKPDLNESLKEGSRSLSSGSGLRSLRGWIVVAEMALAIILLSGAGLMMRSFIRLMEVDHGYRAENVLTARIELPRSRYRERNRASEFHRQLLERVGSLPGVEAAGTINHTPLADYSMIVYCGIEGAIEPDREKDPPLPLGVVSEDYFRASGIPLIGGRNFDGRDRADSQPVAIVNEAFVRRFFPDQSPIGKRIGAYCEKDLCRVIVGVVGDVRSEKLDSAPQPEIFMPYSQGGGNGLTLMVRADTNPTSLIAAIRAQVQLIDPDQPLSDIRTLEQRIAETVVRQRAIMFLLAVFALLALLLAAVGIYGVMSYSVTQRRREIGIRMALGADRNQVLRLILGQGIRLTAVGVALGLAGSFALTRLMESLLFEVSATDPVTFAGISSLLVLVALGACFVPARRATRVDPMTALRSE